MPSLAAFRDFAEVVEHGDVKAALELLVDELPQIQGLGAAQWPHLPTDAGLWVDGMLDGDEVEGFVRYFSGLGASWTDCSIWAERSSRRHRHLFVREERRSVRCARL